MISILLLACSSTAPVAALPTPVAETPMSAEAPVEAPSEAPSPEGLPLGASLYVLDVPLVDQAGNPREFAIARGETVIYSMFYTSCPRACPLLIEDIQALAQALPEADRARLRVVLVSMDPANDTPSALAGIVTQHHLDATWTLAVPPADRVREVAAALGVRYRPLPGGGFAHTSVLTAVDGAGRVLARSDGSVGREALEGAVRKSLAGS